MQDFAVFKVCSLPVPGPKTVFLWVHSKENQKNDDDKQSITVLTVLLKSLCLTNKFTQNTVFVPDTSRLNALSNYSYVWHFRFEITSLPY